MKMIHKTFEDIVVHRCPICGTIMLDVPEKIKNNLIVPVYCRNCSPHSVCEFIVDIVNKLEE